MNNLSAIRGGSWISDPKYTYSAKLVRYKPKFRNNIVGLRLAFKANTGRVMRGGSWGSEPRYVCATHNDNYPPEYRFSFVGFRLSLTPHSTCRTLRGGSWDYNQAFTRAATRFRNLVDDRGLAISFRLRFK